MGKKIRRVVTGHTPEGKSVFVGDGAPPRVVTISGIKDFSITPVWATDHGMTAVPGSDDCTPAMTTFVPGLGGTRFLVTVSPPAGQGLESGIDPAVVAEEMFTKLPGLAQAMELENPGMHTTDTVDYDIIISGELWLELDDGKEVHLKPGDIVIQNGTRHAWRNKGKKPCVMYSVLVGGTASVNPACLPEFPVRDIWAVKEDRQMADTGTTVKEMFNAMPAGLNADAAKGMNSVIQFNLTGDGGGTYHVIIKDGTCTVGEGAHASPNMTMTMAAQDYVDMNTGKLNGQMAFMSGKLKIAGDMGLAMKMQSLFKRP